MNKIILDMDDVIVDLCNPVERLIREEFGINLPVALWHTYDVRKLWNISVDHFLELIIKHDILSKCSPTAGAAEAIKLFREVDIEIHVVTSRGYHPRGQEVTEEWLARHCLEVDAVHIVPHGKPKSKVYQEQNLSFMAIFDDQEHNLADAIESGWLTDLDGAYLIGQPWNRNAEGWHAQRIGCISEAAAHLAARLGYVGPMIAS